MTDRDPEREARRYREILDSLPMLVTVRSADGRYRSVFGDLQILDYETHAELVGRHTEEVLSPSAAEAVLSASREALETGERRDVELSFEFAGERFRRSGRVAPLEPQEDGEPEETVMVTYDSSRRDERWTLLSDVLEILESQTARRDLERAFCERLVEDDRYESAWFGEYRADEGVVVRATAGADAYLDALRRAAGDMESADDPGVRSLRSGEPESTVPIEPRDGAETGADVGSADGRGWIDVAADAGLHAAVALPVEHDSVSHGVLAVYMADASYLTPWREELLVDYADSVGYALSAAMWRWTLATDAAATFELDVAEGQALLDLFDRGGFGDPIDVESVVPRGDETVYYLQASADREGEGDGDGASLRAAVERTPGVRPFGGDGSVRAVVVERETPERSLAGLGVRFEQFRVTPTGATIRATVPHARGVRAAVDRVRSAYPATTVSVRWGEGSGETAPTLETAVAPLLTDKQYEALVAAYRHGYFGKEREHNATEIAEMLGVSRWTFSEHLRVAQRKVFAHLLD